METRARPLPSGRLPRTNRSQTLRGIATSGNGAGDRRSMHPYPRAATLSLAMRRIAALVATIMLSCGDPQPPVTTNGRFCEAMKIVPVGGTLALDLLVVLDTTAAMQGHEAPLQEMVAYFVEYVERKRMAAEAVDLQIGVIAADVDGRFRGGKFLIDRPLDNGNHEINYLGSLKENISALVTAEDKSTSPVQPLASMERALDPGNLATAGFLRQEAYLMVLIVSASDDHSLESVEYYAESLTARKRDQMSVVSVVTSGEGRLTDYARLFRHNVFVDVRSYDWPDVFSPFTAGIRLPRTRCLPRSVDPTDLRPELPGLQVDCELVEMRETDGTERVLPRCALDEEGNLTGASPFPCWLAKESEHCRPYERLELIVKRTRAPSPGTFEVLRCACSD